MLCTVKNVWVHVWGAALRLAIPASVLGLCPEFQDMASLKVTEEMRSVLKLAESNKQISKVRAVMQHACYGAAVPIVYSVLQEVQSMVAGFSGCSQIPWTALKAIVGELRWARANAHAKRALGQRLCTAALLVPQAHRGGGP